MFDRDKWLEILHTMVQNPLRTFLTGVSVALGIFILVVMQGMGFGLQNGVFQQIQNDAVNSIWVRNGQTSLAYRGLNPGRYIRFDNRDLNHVVQNIEGVAGYSGRVGIWNAQMTHGKETQNFGARGIHPANQELEQVDLTAGRYINEGDLMDERKVAVIGKTIVDDLFRGKDPIGEYFTLNGVQFVVIGHFEDPKSRWENRQAYIPITTAQKIFGRSDALDMFVVSTGDLSFDETKRMAVDIENYLKDRHNIHPDDNRAIDVTNNNEEFKTYLDVFIGIRLFIWVIGGFTLLAGIIGVANIMSIVVKERTREIGIRKALGASPFTILSLIIQEALFLTLVAGSFGLVAGVVLLEFAGDAVQHEYFANPAVNFAICATALAVLVVAGVLSGLVPALRAVAVSPVEALRTE